MREEKVTGENVRREEKAEARTQGEPLMCRRQVN